MEFETAYGVDFETKFIGKKGQEQSGPENAYGKTVKFDKSMNYYVLVNGSHLIDPANSPLSMPQTYKLKKTTKEIFELYRDFLKTNNGLLYTKARRLFLQG